MKLLLPALAGVFLGLALVASVAGVAILFCAMVLSTFGGAQ